MNGTDSERSSLWTFTFKEAIDVKETKAMEPPAGHLPASTRNGANGIRKALITSAFGHGEASPVITSCDCENMRDAGFEPAAKSPFLEESANRLLQIPSLKDLRGLELCEIIAACPDLPEALRAGVLAIVRT